MSSQSFIVSRASQLPALLREIERRLAAGPIRVTVGARPSKTREQNAYLHVAIRALAEHLGMADSELKEALKAEYGPEEILRYGNYTSVIRKSMGKYTTEEASRMIEHVERIAADHGLLLEPANMAAQAQSFTLS